MFQNMKMYITDNKTDRNFITKKYFSRKVLIFPDVPDIQSKFPDNSNFSIKKGSTSNSLISLISRLIVNPDNSFSILLQKSDLIVLISLLY